MKGDVEGIGEPQQGRDLCRGEVWWYFFPVAHPLPLSIFQMRVTDVTAAWDGKGQENVPGSSRHRVYDL